MNIFLGSFIAIPCKVPDKLHVIVNFVLVLSEIVRLPDSTVSWYFLISVVFV